MYNNNIYVKQNDKHAQLKNDDWGVLAQSLERVLVTSAICVLYSSFVVFAVSGGNCWTIVYKRNMSFDENDCLFCEEEICIFPVECSSVNFLWEQVTYAAEVDIKSFLIDDAHILIGSIQSLGYNPFYCRTKLIGQSGVRVYAS
jgi:hypothetical protein